ncbi:peptidase [Biscogniauxia marginata]|nr:peptidase [Biscogniauxia marginata]
MGSLGSSQNELTVLVTGFGPFKENCPVNPSGEIAASLPDYLPGDRTKDPARQTPSSLPPVRILKLPDPVHVSYDVVRGLVPKLWDNPEQKIDYAIHIGMAGPQRVYSLERRAHRDGYDKEDVDGKLLRDEKRRQREGDDWIWHGLPEELLTDLDIEDVYQRCVERGLDLYLQISDDPGRYLCDFIYFSSLAHLSKRQRPKKVVFLHVPQHADQKSLNLGKELALALVRSIVESELSKKSSE